MNGHPFTHPLSTLGLLVFLTIGLFLAHVTSTQAQSAQNEPSDTTGRAYIVKPGDSLSKIARTFYNSQAAVPAIVEATNQKAATDPSFRPVRDPSLILSGQKLWLPDSTAVTDGASTVALDPEPAARATIVVTDQALATNNVLTVARVTTAEPGQLVIHRSRDGAILGQTTVAAGVTTNVPVTLDTALPLGTRLLAVLDPDDVAPDGSELTSVGLEAGAADSPWAVAPFAIGLPGGETPQDILTTLQSSAELSVLAAALKTVEMAELLRSDTGVTIFLPTDTAFAALPADTLELLLSDANALQEVLRYHMLPGSFFLSEQRSTQSLTTLQGAPLVIDVRDDGVFVNESAVLVADAPATNGVLHVIDHVLLPPGLQDAARADGEVVVLGPPSPAASQADTDPRADTTQESSAAFTSRNLLSGRSLSSRAADEPSHSEAAPFTASIRDRLRNTMGTLSTPVPQSSATDSD